MTWIESEWLRLALCFAVYIAFGFALRRFFRRRKQREQLRRRILGQPEDS